MFLNLLSTAQLRLTSDSKPWRVQEETSFQGLTIISCTSWNLQNTIFLKGLDICSADAFFERSDAVIAIEAVCAYLPESIIDLMWNLPINQMKRLREYMKIARRVAQDILDKQRKLFETGKEGSKDIMSILGTC